MNEMETPARRLDRVERENRWFRCLQLFWRFGE